MKRPELNSSGRGPSANAGSDHSGRFRSGFTLLELILVLAILILVSALSIPSINRSFQQQAVRKGADLFRASMGDARVKAMRTGEIHAVFYIPGQSFYSVAPLNAADVQSQIASTQLQQIQNGVDVAEFPDNQLPRGITFAAGNAELDGRALEAQSIADVGNGSMKRLLFYPDGSSQNAIVVLQNEKGGLMQIVLRGLTGTSTSQRVDRAEALR